MINILIACGSGIATSSLAADEVKKLCEENDIKSYKISKCSMTQLPGMIDDADIILTTNKFQGEIDKPHMSIIGFISGIGEEKLKSDLLQKLKELM